MTRWSQDSLEGVPFANAFEPQDIGKSSSLAENVAPGCIDLAKLSPADARRREQILFTYAGWPHAVWPEGVAAELKRIEGLAI